MGPHEQSDDGRGEARRYTARFAALWDEHRRLAEQLAALESSTAWAVARRLSQLRQRLAPEGSRRQRYFRLCVRGLRLWRLEGVATLLRKTAGKLLRRRTESQAPRACVGTETQSQRTCAYVGASASPSDFLCCGSAAPESSRGEFRVAFIGSLFAGESMRYRAHNIIEALALVGLEAAFVALEDAHTKFPTILSHDLIVMVRTNYNNSSAALIEAVRRRGLPIVYDIDDYIFDPWVMPYVECFRTINRTDALRTMDEVGACLDQCDYFTGSTSYLAERAAELGKKSFVIRNGLSAAQVVLSRLALAQRTLRRRDPSTRIGYFSGTRTHQADFRVVYPALMRLLREESNCRLVIVGQLDVGEFPGLALFMDQIDLLPLRHWSELPAVIAGVDINLIPLELTPFNEGKSNLKYYEAGLLKVPSIASPTRINSESIEYGHNGLLAQTSEEWYDGLKTLVSSEERRQQMGQNAFEHVLRHYVPQATASEAVEVYRQILHHHRFQRQAA